MISTYAFFFIICLKNVRTTESRSRFYKVSLKPGFDDLVEHSGAVDSCFAPSKTRCTTSCNENIRCVSFFYNLETKECVMHSKEFHSTFTAPSNSGKGWRYYVAQDGKTSDITQSIIGAVGTRH